MLSNDTLYLGNATTHPKEPLIGYSIGSHMKMAHMLNKKLKEHKMEKSNVGPYHDNVIERGGTHEDYANELLPHIMLKMPQKMYNFLISHKGPVENVKKDFIDHLSKNPEHSDQLDLDYMYILSPE
jgi:hypothetical protein